MLNKVLILVLVVMCGSGTAFAAKDYMEKIPAGVKAEDYEPGAPVKTDYQIDLDGDKKKEHVRVNYGPGVSDKALNIQILRGKKKAETIKAEFGIQSNYRIADIDKDGKKEIIIWSGIWDPRMAGEDGVTEQTYEGHSAPHRYIVATYKQIRGEFYLWDVYTTKKKYEPFCEEQPVRD